MLSFFSQKEIIIYPTGIKWGCDDNKVTHKHLNYRLNALDEFKVEILIFCFPVLYCPLMEKPTQK